ncbi:MAG TPA: cation diffusion facilitator family transporter [Streptosporangiaceae bacterium]|nr:cation diffusion facilitator family transporter [Streptosporangiaceae bacterium]
MSKSDERATRNTVLIAGAANLFVAVVKVAAGVLTASSALLAEAAHSAADTLNQAFLLASIRRGSRPADPRHPFGYGQERYFWSLLAAFGIFVAGAGFSVFEGVLAITHPDHGHNALIGYVVLVVAGLAEFVSFVRALSQSRRQAAGRHQGLLSHLRSSADTTVKAALFEDSAAMVGLVLAAAGLGLRQLTGSGVWDGAASIAIGGLLVVAAVRLGLDSRELLIGRAADPRLQQVIRDEIEHTPGVDGMLELLTMHMGPDHLIVAARVAFSDQIGAGTVEELSERIDRRLAERLPVTSHVFIDPTDNASGSRGPLLPEPGQAAR